MGRLEAILASFDGCDHALGLSEISHRVGLPKSTVHRLANQLCAVGGLEKNSGGYRVGLKLLELGSVALQRTGLREAAFKHIHSLALPTRIGGREPAYCTAVGKAMRAFEEPAGRASALAHMPRRTEFTITEPRAMQGVLESIRQTGVAYDREEAYQGLGCVAAPIRSGGRTIGAISATGPIARTRAHALVSDVRDTACAIWSGQMATLSRPLISAH